MVILNTAQGGLPAGAFAHLNKFYPQTRVKWVCGWVDGNEGEYQTCYCVFFYGGDLHCVRIFPVGFGTDSQRWELSVDNTIHDAR